MLDIDPLSYRIHPHRNSLEGRFGLDTSVRARKVGLTLPRDLSLDSWERIGDQLYVIGNCAAWWLGDWLVYGQDSFPGRYRQAMAKSSLSYKTLRNYAWIARNVPVSRRRDTLSVQHHAQVAAFPEEEQEAWLARAHQGKWSLSRLRSEIQASRQIIAYTPAVTVTVAVQISSEREQEWKAAAEIASVPLAEWIALTLDQAAARVAPSLNSHHNP
ncbi:LmbU family transcriptional regulator [Nonomuraea sp. NPDC059007]|uniref:LmbU family transcriptional regulator n=1 Tax=Nonomuraea sp. NPDC059007 TaxID=3346692 RepID=UPI0036B968D3